jgi:TolB-like protein/DNA-binding winged helix-turn-helix (wHTH) protein
MIDLGRQRVTRGESHVPLPKLSYDLLLALVRAAPNLVSLDALMEQVWVKTVVSPETVSQRVKLLRDALGDDPRSPNYIEGLRGRGYRLVPPVLEEAPPTPEPGPPEEAVAELSVPTTSERPDSATPVETTAQPVVSIARIPRRARALWLAALTACLIGGLVGVLVRHAAPPKTRTNTEVVAMEPGTVAVLPFDNLSDEPNNDYIALGIADAVLHQLAGTPALIVISRSSSFALGKPVPEPGEAGRRLGARYLVSGSVQRSGQVLRVTAQLTDTRTNIELWSVKLDRTIGDLFTLQDQIAKQVAQRFDITLRARADYARYGTEAYLAFLRGRAFIESRKLKDVEASIQEFSRAVELAPTFAAAIAELARAKFQLAALDNNATARIALVKPELDILVARAIQIDPTAGEPYFLRSRLIEDTGDPALVEADLRKGLQLAPNFGPGLRAYSDFLFDQHRYDESLVLLDRARLVEPLSAENHYRKGELLRMVFQRYDDAAALYLQAISVQPEFYPAYTRLAMVRWETGKLAEAIRYGEKSVAIEPSVGWTRERLVWFYVDLGDVKAARDVLRGYAPGAALMAAPEALVCYRAGNLERAERILRKNINDPELNIDGFAFVATTNALIERAVTSHDASAARQFILAIPGLKKTGDSLALVEDNFPTIVQLAILEHAAGRQGVADDLARHVLQFLGPDRDAHLGGGWDEWSRAAASAILGNDDAAIAQLESLVRSGYRLGWWVRIERDPAFVRLHSNPRYQAIVSDLSVWLAGEMQQLAQWRLSGEVPQRTADSPTATGC